MRGVFTGIGLLVVLALASGVIWFVANKATTTASRPVVICGQTLYSGADGLPVYSPFSGPVGQGPVGATASTPILFQLSVDCDQGAEFSVLPAGLVRIDKRIGGSHGGTVALSLIGVKAGRATFTLLSGDQSGWRAPFLVLVPK